MKSGSTCGCCEATRGFQLGHGPALAARLRGSRIVPPETQQKLKDTLPNVRIVVMPGLGHYPDEEDTPGFMTIVGEFLRDRVAPR